MSEVIRMQEWWLVRHAPVLKTYIYGQQDVDADYSDLLRIKALAHALPEEATIFSSDLKRCVKTAHKIAAEKKWPKDSIYVDARLREQHFGEWQGLTYSEAEKVNKTAYDKFWEDPVGNKPPKGESFQDLVKRVGAVRRELSRVDNDDKMVLFTHAGTIRALVAEALNVPLDRALSLAVDPLSITKITLYKMEQGESWKVDWVNRL